MSVQNCQSPSYKVFLTTTTRTLPAVMMGGAKMWTVALLMALVTLSSLPEQCHSANILFIPSMEYSHCNYMNGIGRELAQRGHKPVMYLCEQHDFRDCPGPHFEVVTYNWPNYYAHLGFKAQMNKDVFEGNWKPLFLKMNKIKEMFCEMMEQDDGAIQRLRELKFDFAIIDGLVFTRCYYLVPYNLSIPYATVASILEELNSGLPVSPSFYPNKYTDYTSVMSFPQRLKNTLWFVLPHVIGLASVPVEKFKLAPELTASDVEALYRKSELFLDNTDVVLNYPKPLLPNYRQVGGLTTQPAKPLTQPLLGFFDRAEHGVIIMSFGSLFEDDNDILTAAILSAFNRLPQRVVMKGNVTTKVSGNVQMVTWVPLNDACAHPKTRLLIYHCGNNGHFESLYHGIPMICIPIIADQFSVAARVEHFGMGLKLDARTLTADDLHSAVRKVLDDPSYSQNAKKYSALFRSRRQSPAQRAVDAIEEVITFGGEHLRSSHMEQSWFHLLNLDIWLFIFVVFQLVLLAAFYVVRHLMKSACWSKCLYIFIYMFVPVCIYKYFYF